MESTDEDERRNREKFPKEREYRRDEDRRDYGMKRSAPRGDYGPPKRSRNDDDESVMMTFKKFLLAQEDDISDEAAIAKYAEYKLDFKRQQIHKFFISHKEEEWFQQKYHPEISKKVQDAHLENVKKRLDIFTSLKDNGTFDPLTLDHENAKDIIRVLDTVVVLLEGGTDEDVEALKNEKITDESIDELEKKDGDNGNGEKTEEDGAITDDEAGKKRMLLHKTNSVFLRNIPPSVTEEEIEAICKRSPGFLRIAMADVIPERKFYRRGWATYKREVNIKEICWNLNSIKIRDSDLNAIINRDLTRRIRTTNGVTAHKQVLLNDLRIAAKLAATIDKRIGLFEDGEQPLIDREKDIALGVDLVGQSKNPLVKQAKATLMDVDAEEISPEEEELLRRSGGVEASEEKATFVRDNEVIKVLDSMILYLRIVHSIDFYGHLDYPNEDKMPSRCGILHVRGQPPSGNQFGTSDDGKPLLSTKFVNDFTSGFNQRLETSLLSVGFVSDEELEKLGKKDSEKEVEAFIAKNSVELAKDKWLCPLSGKKFKGPEFIRKHLSTKHEDKLNEAKQEALFFNNYLADPKRPVEAEVKSTPTPTRENERRDDDNRYGNRSNDRRPPPRGYGGYGNDSFGGRPNRGGRYFDDAPRGGMNRPQVSYRDLDAPDDIA